MCEENRELAEFEKQQKTNQISSHVFQNAGEFNNLYKIATMFAKSTLVPDRYHGKAEDCMIAVDMANRMGVSPMMVMQNLFVIKGVPAWSGQACNTLVRASGRFKDIKHVYTGIPGEDSWGCYLQATRLSDGETVKGTEITIDMAKKSGWYSKKDKYGKECSFWQTMPEQMLAYRASAFFARVHCPDRLMGVQTEFEVYDMLPSEKQATIVKDPFANKEPEKLETKEPVTMESMQMEMDGILDKGGKEK